MPRNPDPTHEGFTVLEALVVVAIVVVIASIAMPVVHGPRKMAKEMEALRRLRDLRSVSLAYTTENDGKLLRDGTKNPETWEAAAAPENSDAWYNVVLKQMNRRAVGDYANSPKEFYTKNNPLYAPGATYPGDSERLHRPLFAIAINAKLQPRETETAPVLKVDQIAAPAKTVLFLEQGLPGEEKRGETDIQRKSNYDGAPRGDAKSFVGRHRGKGFVMFVDGHVEEFAPHELLTETGAFPFPPTNVIWCRTPNESPNKK